MKAGLLIGAALLLTACMPRSSKPATSDANFTGFVDEYFASYFAFYPTQGSAAGLHDYDSKLEDFSNLRMRDRVSDIRGQNARLQTLMDGKLSEDNAIDAAILDGQLQSEIQELDVLRTWRKNPLFYLTVVGDSIDVLMKRNFAPQRDRLLLVNERLLKMRALLDSMRDNVNEPPPEFTYLASRITRGAVEYFRDTVPTWAKVAAGHDDGLASLFRSANRKVITDLQVLEDYFRTDLKTLSGGDFAIGSEAFANKLRYEEMIDIPLDKLLAIGEDNLRKDREAFVAVARRAAPGRSPSEAMKALSGNHPNEQELLAGAEGILENLRQFVVDKKILNLPSSGRPKVAETPPFLRAGIFAAMDSPGAYEDKATEAFYYLTPTESGWTPEHKEEHLRLFNRPVMNIISIHEVFPGHFSQFLYSSQFPTKTRKLISANSNAEGWAHYAEQMMVDEGFGGSDPKTRLAQLSEALLRDCRYVVGMKLHTQKMTVEEGANVFVQQCFQQPANALEEARRGTYDPTYLYYTAGKLQILKLREDYRQKLGGTYSLSKFHDAFIEQGPIPIAMVRKLMLGSDSGPVL